MHLLGTLRIAHRIAGLAAGAALCVLGLSGSALVFRPELERLFRPDVMLVRPAGGMASVDQMASRVRAAFPDADLYRVQLPSEPHHSFEFMLGTGGRITTRVYVNPYDLRVLGNRTASTDVFLWLQSLHFDWLAGDRGLKANGVIAAALLVICATGLLLWLRSSSRLGARLAPRWRGRPARRMWGWHVAAGIWTVPVLAVMAFTALYFAFHEPVARAVHTATQSAQRPAPPRVPVRAESASLQRQLESAAQAVPDGRWTSLRLPRALGQPTTILFYGPGDLGDVGANAAYIDPHSGEVLRVDRVRDMSIGTRIVASFVPLHFGSFGGLTTRILWVGIGLTPTLLFGTGFYMWRRGRRRNHRVVATLSSERAGSVLEASSR